MSLTIARQIVNKQDTIMISIRPYFIINYYIVTTNMLAPKDWSTI